MTQRGLFSLLGAVLSVVSLVSALTDKDPAVTFGLLSVGAAYGVGSAILGALGK